MRALVFDRCGTPDALEIRDLPVPSLTAPDEVRVRIRAAALNQLDLFVLKGLKGVEYRFPHVPGADGAGVVEEVGSAVTSVVVGDEVMINPGISCGDCPACRAGEESECRRFQLLGEHRPGTFAEQVVVPARNLAPRPSELSWAESAAFPLVSITAWRMLMPRARVRPGETVLVWGIGGGVAQAALRIAHSAGARVAVTSGSDEKLARAAELGAELCLNHRRGGVSAAVREWTGGRGADVVVDSVGEATWAESLRALTAGGRLVTCGATSGPVVSLDLRKLFWYQWSLLGSTMGSDADFRAVAARAGDPALRPVVDAVLPLERAAEAYGRLADGLQFGKLVLEVSP